MLADIFVTGTDKMNHADNIAALVLQVCSTLLLIVLAVQIQLWMTVLPLYKRKKTAIQEMLVSISFSFFPF